MSYIRDARRLGGTAALVGPPLYRALGADPGAPPTLEDLVRSQQADLAHLRATMDKDLFWRRVGAIATVAGTVFAAAKLADILLAIRRRRAEE